MLTCLLIARISEVQVEKNFKPPGNSGLKYSYTHFIGLSDRKTAKCFVDIAADFGVSAKNTTMKQRRDSFIGTPYW
jgi:hypothetical protein